MDDGFDPTYTHNRGFQGLGAGELWLVPLSGKVIHCFVNGLRLEVIAMKVTHL